MRVLLQRSLNSNVMVDKKIVGSINNGLVLFVGFTQGDDSKTIDYLINKILNIRIFDDENGVMNKSIIDVGGSILSISQFTLYADCTKGNRPSYMHALKSEEASLLYNEFNKRLSKYINVSEGVFGSDMMVSIANNGPVTIMLEKENEYVKK